MAYVHAINCIEVPEGQDEIALSIRNTYIEYFKTKTGFISSTFYKANTALGRVNYINIVVWKTQEAYDAVVNDGYTHSDGMNSDGMKVLGKGFPDPIKVNPGIYEIIESD